MRKGFTALAAAMLLVLTACGDDAGDTTTSIDLEIPAAPNVVTETTADGTTETTAGSSDESNDDDAMTGDSYADLTIDGTTIRFTASDTAFSSVEGVADFTVEECEPDFFGSGFWVIGYPVDDTGELVVAEDGASLGGILWFTAPFEDTAPDTLEFEFEVEYEPLGIDAKYRAGSGPEPMFSFDGNRVSGTVTLDNANGEALEVAFDAVCSV